VENKNTIKIEYNKDKNGKYWKVTKSSYVRWKIVKREPIERKE